MIVTFPSKMRYCSGCAISFMPKRPHHTLCKTCFAWSRIALAITFTRKALETVR